MSDKYDIYLYRLPNPDRVVAVKNIDYDTVQNLASKWWDADPNNDLMTVPAGDEVFIFVDNHDIHKGSAEQVLASIEMFEEE